VRSVETNLGAAAVRFDAGLVSLAALQQQTQYSGVGSGSGDCECGYCERISWEQCAAGWARHAS
jgi:hypothetical protein